MQKLQKNPNAALMITRLCIISPSARRFYNKLYIIQMTNVVVLSVFSHDMNPEYQTSYWTTQLLP